MADSIDSLKSVVSKLIQNFVDSPEFICKLQQELGGQQIYIPAKDRAARDAQIIKDYCPSKVNELCQKYSISRRQLRRIVYGKWL